MTSIPHRGAGRSDRVDSTALDGITFQRVAERDHTAALGVLLTGGSRGAEAAVAHFKAFAVEQGLSLEHLWSANRSGRCIAAALVVPNAGRTGMLFVSPVRRRQMVPIVAELVRQFCGSIRETPLVLVQALLDPGQTLEAEAIERAGACRLAKLIYMQRRADLPLEDLDLPEGMHALEWSERHRRLFERAIEQSYEGTLDCPGLVGLRSVRDVIEGHMAAGEFDPAMWTVVMAGDCPAGVMLLNGVPQREAVELVYLGLAPRWRGRGLGGRLLKRAIGLAARRGARHVILAVDQNNAPAVHLYRSLRFAASARKLAMLFILSAKGRENAGFSTPSPDSPARGG